MRPTTTAVLADATGIHPLAPLAILIGPVLLVLLLTWWARGQDRARRRDTTRDVTERIRAVEADAIVADYAARRHTHYARQRARDDRAERDHP